MGQLSKDIYFRKEMYAHEKQLAEFAKINLKEANKEKLQTIAANRHALHQNLECHARELANTESAQHEYMHQQLQELAALTKYELDHVEDMPYHQDHEYGVALDGFSYEEWLEYCDEYYIKLIHQINIHAENYLRRIDRILNINICPSGSTRIY